MNSNSKQEESPSQSLTTQTSNEISIYKGNLTKEVVTRETAKIMAAFPKMPDATINLLKERFKENGFTDKRLKDAVANVIDSYQGWDKSPNIANFISFDRKIKIFNYKESLEYGQKYLTAIDVDGKAKWAKTEDVEKFKLKKWQGK